MKLAKTNQKFDKMLAYHCGPALTGIKPANLVSMGRGDCPDCLTVVAQYNEAFKNRSIRIELLCECKQRFLFLVYRRSKLERFLSEPRVRKLLEQAGYPQGAELDGLLAHLRGRLQEQGDFPHEIGLFLGYPVEDMEGFLQNRGEGYLLCGHWKVYESPEEKQKLFERYDRCRAALIRRIGQGISIPRLFCAV